MASAFRLGVHRSTALIVQRRSISTTLARRDALPAIQTAKKPIGGFRAGIVGFLFGFSLASSYAAYHLLEEYQQASAALQASVEELRLITEKVSAHVKRIEAVERDLKALAQASASKDDNNRIRAEVKRLYDSLHVEYLDLKTHVWGIQQDLHTLSKKDSTSTNL